MKKLPGCDAERMCYDASDRLVFQEDGNLRQSGRRQFFLYDALGREAVRGTCKATAGFADGNIVCATYTGSGLFDGYSADIDLADVELLQTTYYDDYAFLNRLPVNERTSLTFASRSGYSGKSSNTRGLPTGSVMHRLDGMGSYTVSVSYYDVQGRVVCQRSTNHLGGAEVTHTNYTFTGKTKKYYCNMS